MREEDMICAQKKCDMRQCRECAFRSETLGSQALSCKKFAVKPSLVAYYGLKCKEYKED